jgi:hypothetical protein
MQGSVARPCVAGGLPPLARVDVMESKALIAFGRVNILLHVTGVPCSARTFQR